MPPTNRRRDTSSFTSIPASSWLDVLLERLGPSVGAVDVAAGVDRGAFGGAVVGGLLVRVGNEPGHLAVSRAADPDPPLPRPVGGIDRAGLGIGDVDHVIPVDEDPAGPAELLPFGQQVSLLVHDQYPVVAAVANEQASPGIHGQCVGLVHTAASGSLGPEIGRAHV